MTKKEFTIEYDSTIYYKNEKELQQKMKKAKSKCGVFTKEYVLGGGGYLDMVCEDKLKANSLNEAIGIVARKRQGKYRNAFKIYENGTPVYTDIDMGEQ